MKKLRILMGRLLCRIGLHKVDDSWCQRPGCTYHETNC